MSIISGQGEDDWRAASLPRESERDHTHQPVTYDVLAAARGENPWSDGWAEPEPDLSAKGWVQIAGDWRWTGAGPAPMRASTYQQRLAMKWALVRFVVALEERKAEDLVNASEANGWRQRSAHDLYDDVIDTVSRLATGSLDAAAYLAEERRKALETER